MSWMALKGLITVCGFLLVRKRCTRERRPQDTRVSCFCVHTAGERDNDLICVSVYVCVYCSHMCLERTQRLKGKHRRQLTVRDKAHPQTLTPEQEGMLGKSSSERGVIPAGIERREEWVSTCTCLITQKKTDELGCCNKTSPDKTSRWLALDKTLIHPEWNHNRSSL